MRFLIAGLLLAASLPLVGAADQKSRCKSTCSTQYDFCMKSSPPTKQARKNCAIARKNCTKGCGNTNLPH
jgi:hypothetical protein